MSTSTTPQRLGAAVFAVMLAFTLTGCNPPSIASASYPGLPSGVGGDLLNIPRAFSDGPVLYLSLGGSSSCPPVPTSVVVVDGEMEITIDHKPAVACTADMAVITYEINIGSVPKVVVLVFDGEERQTLPVESL